MPAGLGPPSTARWIEGRVESEAGLPFDEEMTVIAEGRTFKSDPGRSDTYRAEVGGDGRFRVAFSPDTRSGRLYLEGRYAFLNKPKIVKPRKMEKGEEVLLEVSLGGRIEVEVLPPTAAAFLPDTLKALEVRGEVRDWGGPPRLNGRPQGNATFELGGARPGQAYDITAISPIHANGRESAVKVEPGQTTRVQVELSQGTRLAGVVRDSMGEPVLSGKVSAMSSDQAGMRNPIFNRGVADVTEIQAGEFELLGVPSGAMTLVVEVDGFLEHKRELGELFDGGERNAISITVSRGGIVSGVVRWPDGEPAAGAEVRISQEDSMGNFDFERVHDEVTLGPDGGFTFSALKEGMCAVTAVCVERGWEIPEDATLSERKFGKRPSSWRAHEDKVAPGRTNLALVLVPGSDIQGRVLDDAGEPVEAFRITAFPADVGFLSSNGVRAVKKRFEDEHGRFVLPGLMAGDWKIRASATGYGQGKDRPIRAPYKSELQMSLPRAGVIEGVVRTPDGSSAKEARVEVQHGNDRSMMVDVGSEGVFKASKVQPGGVTLTARMDGFARSLPLEFEMGAAGRRESLVLDLRRGASIFGQLHESVKELAGRSVRINGPYSREVETEGDGSFRILGLDPGAYQLSLTPLPSEGTDRRTARFLRRTNTVRMEVELGVGQVENIVLGEPSPTSVLITGRVLDEGQVVPYAVVTVRNLDSSKDAGAQANLEGVYELRVDEPGDYRFEVGRTFVSRSGQDISVPAVKEFRRDLELAQGQLRGRVVGPGGSPVGGVFLSLSAEPNAKGGNNAALSNPQTQSLSDGSFEFEGVAPGTYNLRASQFNGRADLANVLIRNIEVAESESPEIQVELPVEGEAQGIVQDSQGNPVSGATIEAQTEDGLQIASFSRVRSGSDGSFTQGSLPPGDVWLRARIAGRQGEPVKVRVVSDGTVQATLVVPDETN